MTAPLHDDDGAPVDIDTVFRHVTDDDRLAAIFRRLLAHKAVFVHMAGDAGSYLDVDVKLRLLPGEAAVVERAMGKST